MAKLLDLRKYIYGQTAIPIFYEPMGTLGVTLANIILYSKIDFKKFS